MALELAQKHGRKVEFSHHDRFAACTNHNEAAQEIPHALDELGITYRDTGQPLRGSRGLGQFGHHAKSARYPLEAGETHPVPHNPDYDFAEALIPQGAMFDRIPRKLLG